MRSRAFERPKLKETSKIVHMDFDGQSSEFQTTLNVSVLHLNSFGIPSNLQTRIGHAIRFLNIECTNVLSNWST
jgi:hypothetical protein